MVGSICARAVEVECVSLAAASQRGLSRSDEQMSLGQGGSGRVSERAGGRADRNPTKVPWATVRAYLPCNPIIIIIVVIIVNDGDDNTLTVAPSRLTSVMPPAVKTEQVP